MCTLEEALERFSARDEASELRVLEVHSRYKPTIDDIKNSEMVSSLLMTVLQDMVTKDTSPLVALHVAFATGLMCGVEMTKTDENIQ